MPKGLVRHHETGHLHFVTFSCYHRRPYLNTPHSRTLFEHSLEAMRERHSFHVIGYVVMPEHVHLLLSEPDEAPLSKAIQALKLSVSVQSPERPFWQPRYYDFNVFSEAKRLEKLHYMHYNPVTRGLVPTPESWLWSSHTHYTAGKPRTITLSTEAPLLNSSPINKSGCPRSQRDLGKPNPGGCPRSRF